MQSLRIQAHKLRDVKLDGWKEKIAGKWHYRDLAACPVWREGWISFDALAFNPADGGVYCGLNSIDGDLLYRFDPDAGDFTGLHTRRWTDAFDAKIHRTLLLNSEDDCFYFGTSLLHDIDQQTEAPGGKLVRYDWRKDDYTTLAVPFPPLYIQSIAMDPLRGILYGFTYPAEMLFRYDMSSGKTRILGYIGNATLFAQPHNAVVDRHGWLWGTCAETRAWDERPGPCPIRLFKYHPDEDRFVWFDFGLSRREDPRQLVPDPGASGFSGPDWNETRHKEDYGFCDSMAYDGGRYIYAGTVAGVLCRIDVDNDRVEKVCHIMPSGRFPALGFGSDGLLYGAGGMKGETALCRLNPTTLELKRWENIVDPETDERPARIHELCVSSKGVVYLAENDNHTRSSYLWSVEVGAG